MEKQKVTESIYSGVSSNIPMAEVSHIAKDRRPDYAGCHFVIFKHSKWNEASQEFEPNVYMLSDEAEQFNSAWCLYRSEIDGVKSLSPEN